MKKDESQGPVPSFFYSFLFRGKDLLSTGPTNIHTKEKMKLRVVPIPEWHVVDNNISVGSVFGKLDNMIDLCFTRKKFPIISLPTGSLG